MGRSILQHLRHNETSVFSIMLMITFRIFGSFSRPSSTQFSTQFPPFKTNANLMKSPHYLSTCDDGNTATTAYFNRIYILHSSWPKTATSSRTLVAAHCRHATGFFCKQFITFIPLNLKKAHHPGTNLQTAHPINWCSTPHRGIRLSSSPPHKGVRLSSSPKYPHKLFGPPSLLSSG
jgi:hypothetical protein